MKKQTLYLLFTNDGKEFHIPVEVFLLPGKREILDYFVHQMLPEAIEVLNELFVDHEQWNEYKKFGFHRNDKWMKIHFHLDNEKTFDYAVNGKTYTLYMVSVIQTTAFFENPNKESKEKENGN